MTTINTVLVYLGVGIAVAVMHEAARELRERGALHAADDPTLRTSEFIACVVLWPPVAFLLLMQAGEWAYQRGRADYRRLKAWFDKHSGGRDGH